MHEIKVFEKIYQEYMGAVSRIDLGRVKDRLGLKLESGEAIIPFYGIPFHVSARGIGDVEGGRPNHAVSVILCKYLLLCPEDEPVESDWVTYRDFKDAAPFVAGFLNHAERPIARTFSGRLSDLRQACMGLTGQPVDAGIASDLVMRMEALPKVPILLLFNDRDEEFPASCSLLFERRAEKYLDMECLAMTGWALSEWLKKKALNDV